MDRDMNILYILGVPLGYVMEWIYNLIPNYGWDIIIFTIVIRLISIPLQLNQQKSMAKMSAFQPMIADIQKKYKDKPEKQQEELLKLQQEYGYKPTAGCVPMLLNFLVIFGVIGVVYNPLERIFHISAAALAAAGEALTASGVAALLLLLNAGIHLRVGHLADGAGHVQLLVLAQLDFRHHVHFAAELQILAGFHGLHIHLGTGHGLEVVFFHGLIVGFGEQDIQSVLIKNALAEHILNQLAGRLALAEAGNVDLSAQLQIRLLQRVFKLRRGCLEADLYFVAAELFYRMFHVFSSLGAGFPLPHLSKYTI